MSPSNFAADIASVATGLSLCCDDEINWNHRRKEKTKKKQKNNFDIIIVHGWPPSNRDGKHNDMIKIDAFYNDGRKQGPSSTSIYNIYKNKTEDK